MDRGTSSRGVPKGAVWNGETSATVNNDVNLALRPVEETEHEWVDEEIYIAKGHDSRNKTLDLHFVSETGTTRPKGVARNLIRSHARRNKLSEVTPSGQLAQAQRAHFQASTGSGNKSRRAHRTTEDGSKSLRINVRPPGPGTIVLAPFDSLALPSNRHMRGLLNHWETIISESYFPANPRKQWLPYAIADPLVLNTILFVTAYHICGLKGKAMDIDVTFYQGQTIKILNANLRDPKQWVSDSTITAVACLALLETTTGTRENAKTHMDGLEAMVKNRGGLRKLHSDGSLMGPIAVMADNAAAIVLETRPRFDDTRMRIEHNPGGPADSSLSSPVSLLTLQYRTKLQTLTGSKELSSEMADLVQDMQDILRKKDEASWAQVERADFESSTDKLELLERRLIALVQDPALVPAHDDMVIYSMFGNAAFIHIYGFARDQSLSLPFFQRLSHRIRTTIEGADFPKLKIRYPEIILWILIMGGMGGAEDDRKWFAKRVGEFCLALGMHGGREIALMLKEFLWTELYRSPVTAPFWNDVAAAQGFVGGYGVKKVADHVSVAIFNNMKVVQ